MVSPSKVGELLFLVGDAFQVFSSLTKQLRPTTESPTGNLNEEEIEMFKETIKSFTVNLLQISEKTKIRLVSATREKLKKKAFEDAGLPVPNAKSPEPENNLEELEDVINNTFE